MKRLLLVGGGHAHVEVLRRFGRAPLRDVELVLVSPHRLTPYSGMLPGLVAGDYEHAAVHIDLERAARFARARFLQTLAAGIDTHRRVATLANGASLEFDLVSLDVGSTPATAGVPGAAEHAIGVKPVDRFLQLWDNWCERARTGTLRRLLVVGGGAAGVETILAMHARLARETGRPDAVACALATDADQLLPMHPARVQDLLGRVLARRGIRLHLATPAVRIEPGAMTAADGSRIAADAIVWTTGAAAPPWLRGLGVALDAGGFVAVNESLQSISEERVFAAGDCATMIEHPRPRAGVYAVRQGPPLAANLRAALEGRPLARYVPQAHALAIISTGDGRAVAARAGWAVEGAWVWRWKDWIDRRFVARYAAL
ncbi:MAG TPA: FAD-dependent oxidoreductase [Burkholderiales bacterium]|nr:FAD-dependent oxidoreductase [Burkholderiales bacterium]